MGFLCQKFAFPDETNIKISLITISKFENSNRVVTDKLQQPTECTKALSKSPGVSYQPHLGTLTLSHPRAPLIDFILSNAR